MPASVLACHHTSKFTRIPQRIDIVAVWCMKQSVGNFVPQRPRSVIYSVHTLLLLIQLLNTSTLQYKTHS